MIVRSLFATTLIVVALFVFARAEAETPSPVPSATASPSLPKPARLAPFKERLAAAQSVKVQTEILGIGIDSSLDAAHVAFDSLCDSAHRPKEDAAETERDEREHKVLWQLAKTNYGSVFVKADESERIIYIAAYLRPGKEMPFDKIGELEKAPILTDRVVAWDVVRPDWPLVRVVARGEGHKASSITMFIVKRPHKE